MTIKARDDSINKALIARAEDTISNQSKILSSILDKEYRSIRVDRIVTIDPLSKRPILHTLPDDILKIAPTCYKDILKKRNHKFDSLTQEWKNIYEPLQHIPDDIYQNLLDEPSELEWNQAISKCLLNTAPGISGISYMLIKRLPPSVHTVFRKLASVLFSTGLILSIGKLRKYSRPPL